LLLYGSVAGRMSVGTYSVLVFLIQQFALAFDEGEKPLTNINEHFWLLSES